MTDSTNSPFPGVLTRLGIRLLRDAWLCACNAGEDPWQFALEIDVLKNAGLSENELRWLISQRLLKHAEELTDPNDDRRQFQPIGSLLLTRGSCFVLTKEGFRSSACSACTRSSPRDDVPGHDESSSQHLGESRGDTNTDDLRQTPGDLGSASTPHWDPHARELRLGPHLIKRFARPAPLQELILSVFEEEGWPPMIDDPLPPQEDQDPKRRLHHTIRNLNRAQLESHQCHIHFYINGDGQSIRWQIEMPRS